MPATRTRRPHPQPRLDAHKLRQAPHIATNDANSFLTISGDRTHTQAQTASTHRCLQGELTILTLKGDLHSQANTACKHGACHANSGSSAPTKPRRTSPDSLQTRRLPRELVIPTFSRYWTHTRPDSLPTTADAARTHHSHAYEPRPMSPGSLQTRCLPRQLIIFFLARTGRTRAHTASKLGACQANSSS